MTSQGEKIFWVNIYIITKTFYIPKVARLPWGYKIYLTF